MKRGLIFITIASVMLTACILELVYVRNTFDKMCVKVESLIVAIETDEEDAIRPETLRQAKDLKEFWNKRKRLTEVMLNHILLIEYDARIARVQSDIEVGDRDLAKIDADQLLEMTRELKDLHTPYIHNVF